jgi:ferredoxin-NADP reductase
MTARLIMRMSVASIEVSTPEVNVFTFRHPTRTSLPTWSPGAHIDVRLPDGRVRQYSLCGDPNDSTYYRIAIKRQEAGRGGSLWCHESLIPGSGVLVSAPRNNFPLARDAVRHLMLAGGIGVTPFAAAARVLSRAGADVVLHFAARSPEMAPLLAELREILGSRLVTWFESEGRRFEPSVLGSPSKGTHLYVCGPEQMLQAMREHTIKQAWPANTFHIEFFSPPSDENFKAEPFDIYLARSGTTLQVPANRSALEVLRDHGIALPSACETGLCGSCACGYRDGVVIHRDVVLSMEARREQMTPCVSRAQHRVTLDL